MSFLPTPAPLVQPEAAPYWAAADEGRLRLPRCLACEQVIWYPREVCPLCHHVGVAWFDSPGLGVVYSFSVIRRAIGQFRDAAPYVLAYVELDEGPRLFTNIVGCPVDQVRIGQRVQVVFDRGDGGAVPRFSPVRTGAEEGR